ncbi:MAG TPA: hypothetical protein VLT86_16255 [Vicinamibacterales bacterium]|nr:hypothetical protein [Vicinamibacterales bacterium]
MHVRAAGGAGDRPGRRKIIAPRARRGLALVGGLLAAAASGSLRLDAQDSGAIPPALYASLTWRCIGPFDGGPVASVVGEAGVPGAYTITTPSGGAWRTIDGGDTWSSIELPGLSRVSDPSAGGSTNQPGGGDARRWVDPANPRRIARTEAQGIAVSLDAGATWTPFRHLPIAEVARLAPHERPLESATSRRMIAGAAVTVSIADPVRAGLVFAGTNDGVYVSFDNGVRWDPLRLNMPAVAINDLDIRGDDLVAATQGRSIWMLDDISPLRQVTAASASAPAMLYTPAAAVARSDGVYLDYYLGAPPTGEITLQVSDAAGRVVHAAGSAAMNGDDRWLPVARPLPDGPGHHRVAWNLRFDPPPSPHHRFARLAPALVDDPSDPDGPRVLAGSYRVTLVVGGRTYTQPLVVRDDPASTPEAREAARRRFALAMQAYDAMQSAHRGFLQLARARPPIKALAASPDPDLASAAADLDARLAALDGSDWTGLVIPDADDESLDLEEDAKEGKHPDFVPPKPVSLSKDYDDPTSVLGRNFANVDHAPAFAIVGTTLGETLARIDRAAGAPDALAAQDYATKCEQLASVLDQWRGINAQDVPRLNVELARRRLAAVPIAGSVPVLSCPAR